MPEEQDFVRVRVSLCGKSENASARASVPSGAMVVRDMPIAERTIKSLFA